MTKISKTARAAKAPKVELLAAETIKPKGKLVTLVELMRRAEGATIEAMMKATGWQAHSVRGAISGAVKKAMSLQVTSEKVDGVRVYRIAQEPAA